LTRPTAGCFAKNTCWFCGLVLEVHSGSGQTTGPRLMKSRGGGVSGGGEVESVLARLDNELE
jgi:hypothetical protein